MKNIYLRIEHLNAKNEILYSEYHGALMDKNYIYFDKYKIKKADTEEHDEKDKSMKDRATRCIKLQGVSKRNDPRFTRAD